MHNTMYLIIGACTYICMFTMCMMFLWYFYTGGLRGRNKILLESLLSMASCLTQKQTSTTGQDSGKDMTVCM